MASSIPPIGTTGKFVLKDPFASTLQTGVSYTCSAIRRFNDITNQGLNVFEQFYNPYDITQDIYNRDLKNNEVIITLTSTSTAPVYVPSSYIAAFPSGDVVKYHRVVLSLDLGMLPDSLDLTFLKKELSNVTSDTVGVDLTVNENAGPYTETVTVAKDLELSAARDAKIKNRTTDYSRMLALQTENAKLKQTISLYESYINKG